MISRPVRLGLVLQADRMIVAVLRSGRAETFVVEAEQPSAALRAELDSRRVRPRGAAVALPRAATTVKPVELPEVGDVGEMVRFELERHLPFPAEDAPFDFVPVAVDPDMPPAPGRRVLVAAVDRRVVDSAVRLVQDAGLRPTSVTVASHNLVGLVKAPRGKRIAWVHRVGADAELLLLLGSTLALTRFVPGADDTVVAAEMRRSLGIARWRAVDEIWVSGDTPPDILSGSAASALTSLGTPVREPAYTPQARKLLSSIEGDERGARELAIAVAAGRRARPLDLIPAPLRVRRFTKPQLITAGVTAATVILAIAALVVPGYRDRTRLESLNAEINRLTPEMRAVERVQKDLERRRALLAMIDSVEASAVRPLPVLRELTDLLPGDAWLTLLSVDAKGIELTGQASAASSLIAVLENSPRFERVEFASPVTRGRGDKEQFRIVARWEGGSPRSALLASAASSEPASEAATPPAAVPSAPAARTPRAVPPSVRAPAAGAERPETPAAIDPGVQPRRPPATTLPRDVRQ